MDSPIIDRGRGLVRRAQRGGVATVAYRKTSIFWDGLKEGRLREGWGGGGEKKKKSIRARVARPVCIEICIDFSGHRRNCVEGLLGFFFHPRRELFRGGD